MPNNAFSYFLKIGRRNHYRRFRCALAGIVKLRKRFRFASARLRGYLNWTLKWAMTMSLIQPMRCIHSIPKTANGKPVTWFADCHPFLAGFHVAPLQAEAARTSYCPCNSQRLDRWHRCFLSESMVDDPNIVCRLFSGPNNPSQLRQHIADMIERCNYSQTVAPLCIGCLNGPSSSRKVSINIGNFRRLQTQGKLPDVIDTTAAAP